MSEKAKHHPVPPTTSEVIETLVNETIVKNGPIAVDQFMNIVLTQPEHGYYRHRDPFGPTGDFTTASEISGLFGEMCGFYLAHMFEVAQQPSKAKVVELGPGRGSLMADMQYTWTHIMPELEMLPVHLVEINKQLRAIQKQRIPSKSLIWHDDVSGLPETTLFGLANEFFDALPIQQAVWRHGAWRHRLVGIINGTLGFVDGPLLDLNEQRLWHIDHDYIDLTEGNVIEYCPTAEIIAETLASRVKQYGGAFLIIDYGKDDNYGDSLQAVADHKPVDLFYQLGNTDISHWVDFKALGRAINNAGARFIGPTTQAEFLMSIGLKERVDNAAQYCCSDGRHALFAAVDRLVGAHHMGKIFKVCLILPQGVGIPIGFT